MGLLSLLGWGRQPDPAARAYSRSNPQAQAGAPLGVLRAAGLVPPAWQGVPGATQPPLPMRTQRTRPWPRRMRPAEVRAYENDSSVRAQALEELRRRERADSETDVYSRFNRSAGTVGGQGQPSLAQDAWDTFVEPTGLPSVRRTADAISRGEPGEALGETFNAALGVGGLLAGGRGLLRRTVRPPLPLQEAPPRLPQPDARILGRASDGSVLPIRPRQPFRQSFYGGSADLLEAAQPRRLQPVAPAAPAGAGREALDWLGNDRLIRNPSEADLARLAELGDEMKYVMDTDGNVYAFSAADAHHNNAMRALRDHGVQVRSLGPGAEITDPDAAGFIWRNSDGSFIHGDANFVESGPYAAFQQRVRPPGMSDQPILAAPRSPVPEAPRHLESLKPEEWRVSMGSHPWINSPSRAQLVIMASAKDSSGRFIYDLADIVNTTGYTENSVPVQLNRARAAGVDVPLRPGGVGGATRPPGGNRLNEMLKIMERAERNGEYLTGSEIGRRMGLPANDIHVMWAQIRNRSHERSLPSVFLERFAAVDAAQARRSPRRLPRKPHVSADGGASTEPAE